MELSLSLFILSLTIAIIAPLVVVRYLRPILIRVLNGLCDADGSAEFWVRCVYILAVSGTLLLVLLLGDFNQGTTTIDALRRALVCVFLGVFITVAMVSRNVWGRVQVMLARQNADATVERGV
ncbi:MAG: hypothetical protein ACRCV6_09655 [Formosimonas sp.]